MLAEVRDVNQAQHALRRSRDRARLLHARKGCYHGAQVTEQVTGSRAF